MSSPESKTCPSVVTTSRGIGGAWRNISVPSQPSTPKEHTKMATKTIHSCFMRSHSSTNWILVRGKLMSGSRRGAKHVPIHNSQFNYRFSVDVRIMTEPMRRIPQWTSLGVVGDGNQPLWLTATTLVKLYSLMKQVSQINAFAAA